MPSQSSDAFTGNGPDFVLGDGFGATCDASVADTADRTLSGLGFMVARNRPYAGGFTTRHYGRPTRGIHALQIEIARLLYMDEADLTPLPSLSRIADASTSPGAKTETSACRMRRPWCKVRASARRAPVNGIGAR